MGDMGPKGKMGHTGSDRSTSSGRLEKYGTWSGTCGENLSYGMDTAIGVIMQLIIDDGISNRNHRQNVFNERYKKGGCGTGPHKVYDIMCCLNYCQRYTKRQAQPKGERRKLMNKESVTTKTKKNKGGKVGKHKKNKSSLSNGSGGHSRSGTKEKKHWDAIRKTELPPGVVEGQVRTTERERSGRKIIIKETIYHYENGSAKTEKEIREMKS